MKWFYFYTPDYAFWHEHLSNRLAAHFDLQPICIQSDELALRSDAGVHHFTGVRRKLELVAECVKAHRGEPVVFSDCTQIIHPERVGDLRAYLESEELQQQDLVFPSNAIDPTVNIGLIRIRCNRKTSLFWHLCLRRMRADSWDQRVVNRMLRRSGWGPFGKIRWTRFDERRMVCGYELKPEQRATYLTYKQFIHPTDPTNNWNSRLESLHRQGLVDDAALTRHTL